MAMSSLHHLLPVSIASSPSTYIFMQIQLAAQRFVKDKSSIPCLSYVTRQLHVMVPDYTKTLDPDTIKRYTLYRLMLLCLEMAGIPIDWARLLEHAIQEPWCRALPRDLQEATRHRVKQWKQDLSNRHTSIGATLGLEPVSLCILYTMQHASTLSYWSTLSHAHVPGPLAAGVTQLLTLGFTCLNETTHTLPVRFRNLVDLMFGMGSDLKRRFPTFAEFRDLKGGQSAQLRLLQSMPQALRSLHPLGTVEYSLYAQYGDQWMQHSRDCVSILKRYFANSLGLWLGSGESCVQSWETVGQTVEEKFQR
jgi:hypothetical protein